MTSGPASRLFLPDHSDAKCTVNLGIWYKKLAGAWVRDVDHQPPAFAPIRFVSISSFSMASPVERWSLVNAVGLLAATAGAVWTGHVWPILLVGGGGLAGFVGVAWGCWTPQGAFGAANAVTAVRAALLAGLPLAAGGDPLGVVGLGLVVLVADGLDGWLARRDDLGSEFGAFFDKETDALFLLLLCALAAFEGRLPVWVLGAGLLRYGFVPLLFVMPAPQHTEDRSSWARYVYTSTVLALLTAFLPLPPLLYQPLVALAAGALGLSFARSLWRIVPRRQPFGRSS
jgi:phosphatidylglycerophosphate synthase